MERQEWTDRIADAIGKYRWAALILALGLLLMAATPGGNAQQEPAPVEQAVPVRDLEGKLEEILSKLDGAGKVKVLLTEGTGAENHFQTDVDAGEKDRQADTVIITSSDRSQQGLVRRTDPPRYRGAVVLCQGADSPAVRLAVVEAVGTATGLTSDKISVLKMK